MDKSASLVVGEAPRRSTSSLDAVRTAVALLVASVVVAAVAPFAVGAELKPYPLYFFVWFFPVVGVFSVFVALPIYISLPPHYQTRLVPVLVAGFVAAGASFTLLEVLFIHTSFEQLGDTVLVRDGWRTLAGWRFLLKHASLMGCAGATGGAAFWAVRRLTIGSSDRGSRLR